jgi:hypothetical protein
MTNFQSVKNTGMKIGNPLTTKAHKGKTKEAQRKFEF